MRSFPDREETGAEKDVLDLLDTWSPAGRQRVDLRWGSLIGKGIPKCSLTFFLSPHETFTKILLC